MSFSFVNVGLFYSDVVLSSPRTGPGQSQNPPQGVGAGRVGSRGVEEEEETAQGQPRPGWGSGYVLSGFGPGLLATASNNTFTFTFRVFRRRLYPETICRRKEKQQYIAVGTVRMFIEPRAKH